MAKRGRKKKAVRCVETGVEYASASDAAIALGKKSPGGICNALKGRIEKIYGYHWEYVNPEDNTPAKTAEHQETKKDSIPPTQAPEDLEAVRKEEIAEEFKALQRQDVDDYMITFQTEDEMSMLDEEKFEMSETTRD